MYPSCSDARVMWDQRSARSRGFGFVSFRNFADAEAAITEMSGKWLGSRPVRCNWASKNSGQAATATAEAPASNGVAHAGGADAAAATGPAQPPPVGADGGQYTTVFVGNLALECSQAELHRQFYTLGAGTIEEVRIQRDKGFGFVRYSRTEEAARAIQMGAGRLICGRPIKCSWGSKPTPANIPSAPLGLPSPSPFPTYPQMGRAPPYPPLPASALLPLPQEPYPPQPIGHGPPPHMEGSRMVTLAPGSAPVVGQGGRPAYDPYAPGAGVHLGGQYLQPPPAYY
eukprot:TRINITY_DN1893_c0_g1_i3.p1 TRINITY_DN1893_c0_g1~~TRINITY_DN1893_c0_g1_i3.p1  ORF type:complete len:285 (+),score=45.62 TRINITY_DN1893_c0_g1_i3:561-1415(+)